MTYYKRPESNRNTKKEAPVKKAGKRVKDVAGILSWIFSIFCFTSVLAYGFSEGSIVLLLTGVFSLPIAPIRNIWGSLSGKGGRWIKPVILAAMFFVGISTVPDIETETTDKSIPTEVIEVTSEELIVESSEDVWAVLEESSESIEEIDEKESEDPSSFSEKEISSTMEISVEKKDVPVLRTPEFHISSVVAFKDSPYTVVNNNKPFFLDEELATTSFEEYSALDSLGRCGVTYACIGTDIMPTEERGEIGSVKPTGWQTVKYNGIVEGNYLYNRCHLIGYQLTGENANTKNLITGTRFLNVEGMLPFENMVADYVKETDNHVLYRVTPVFEGDNLLASGVLMEAKSVEDNGTGIEFCVYCYNVQPGIAIDYATGKSEAVMKEEPAVVVKESSTDLEYEQSKQPVEQKKEEVVEEISSANSALPDAFVVNTKNGKIHMNGACNATDPSSSQFMTAPKGFATYEEAEGFSSQIEPSLEKRKCGNCWR